MQHYVGAAKLDEHVTQALLAQRAAQHAIPGMCRAAAAALTVQLSWAAPWLPLARARAAHWVPPALPRCRWVPPPPAAPAAAAPPARAASQSAAGRIPAGWEGEGGGGKISLTHFMRVRWDIGGAQILTCPSCKHTASTGLGAAWWGGHASPPATPARVGCFQVLHHAMPRHERNGPSHHTRLRVALAV